MLTQEMTESVPVDELPDSGRGWRKLTISLAAWNTCGLSQERLEYVLSDLNQDVTV